MAEKILELRHFNSKSWGLSVLLCCVPATSPSDLSCSESVCLTSALRCSHQSVNSLWARTMPSLSLVFYAGSESSLSSATTSRQLFFSLPKANRRSWFGCWGFRWTQTGEHPGSVFLAKAGIRSRQLCSTDPGVFPTRSVMTQEMSGGQGSPPLRHCRCLSFHCSTFCHWGQSPTPRAVFKPSTILSSLLMDELRKHPLTEDYTKLSCSFHIPFIPGPENHLCAFDELQTNAHFSACNNV